MPRMGRPPSTNPRSISIRTRMTVSEAERLRKCAEARQMTMTAVLMRGLALVEAETTKGQAPTKS